MSKKKKEPKYMPVVGARLSRAQAAVIGDVIETIEKRDGTCTAKAFVQFAKSHKSHPIRKLFEWNTQKAAEVYWLDRARYLIRSVTIKMQVEEEEIKVRATQFVESAGGYVSTGTVMENVDMAAEVVERAEGELIDWYWRYKRLSSVADLENVFANIEKIIAKREAVRVSQQGANAAE